MTGLDVVRVTLIIEIVIGALVVVSLLGAQAVRRRRGTFRASRRAELQSRLVRFVSGGRLSAADAAQMSRAGQRDLIHVLAQIFRSIEGETRNRLSRVARELGLERAAFRDLQSASWARRLRAARFVALIGPTPESIQRMLGDRDPFVRAEAAVCAALWPQTVDAEFLIAMLDDPAPVCRFAAADALMRLQGRVAGLVSAALEARQHDAQALLGVAASMAGAEFLDAALRFSRSAAVGERRGAVRLLRGIGGPTVAARLRELLADSDSSVRAAAAEALGSLGDAAAAGDLRRLLDDSAREVRFEAARALQRMGPSGKLMLRDAAASESAFASTLARTALDIMEEVSRARA